MMELKEFIEDTVVQDEDDTEEIVAPLVEEAINQMSRVELKEFIMENVVEDPKPTTKPVDEEEINRMSMEELREFIEDSPIEAAKTENINQMSKVELKNSLWKMLLRIRN